MIDALTQEHERTVSLARISLLGHDREKPLTRWFDNYKDDKNAMLWSHRWSVVTRDGRRWKVETGLPDSTEPSATYTVDPRAPAPPIFEFRPPPPPEPVKPRYNVAPPPRVPSAMEYIMDRLSYSEQQELRQRIRERQRRRPAYPSFIGVDWARGYEPRIRPEPMRWEDEHIDEREMIALAHLIMDRRFRHQPPPIPQPVRPPPAPTRRNQ